MAIIRDCIRPRYVPYVAFYPVITCLTDGYMFDQFWGSIERSKGHLAWLRTLLLHHFVPQSGALNHLFPKTRLDTTSSDERAIWGVHRLIGT